MAILGPGLLGGSIALALAERFPALPVSLWARREEAVLEIRECLPKTVASTNLERCLHEADLIILATPVGAMPQLAKSIVDLDLRSDALVTDVGSVKGNLVKELDPIFAKAGIRFLGSHPMAGSERTGMQAARPDLFEKALCILTPCSDEGGKHLAALRRFWEELGCQTCTMSPEEHDEAVAAVSHLPHALASIAVTAALAEKPQWARLAGGGLRDTTRVASGSPSMWTEILLENREQVLRRLEVARETLDETIGLLEKGDAEGLQELLKTAKDLRDQWVR